MPWSSHCLAGNSVPARRRLDALVRGHAVRLATEVDLALLGVHAEALLWITVRPGALQETAEILATHPQVRFTAATTGPANLLVAVAATDLDALYAFLITTIGPLNGITTVDTTPAVGDGQTHRPDTPLLSRAQLTARHRVSRQPGGDRRRAAPALECRHGDIGQVKNSSSEHLSRMRREGS